MQPHWVGDLTLARDLEVAESRLATLGAIRADRGRGPASLHDRPGDRDGRVTAAALSSAGWTRRSKGRDATGSSSPTSMIA